MNRCPKIEFGRLGGELSWSGVNSGIIRNRAAQPPTDRRAKPQPLPAANVSYGFETRAIHAGGARPNHGRAFHADLTRPRLMYSTMSITPRHCLNLHNFGYIYSRLTIRPFRCWKNASRHWRRPRRRRRRLRPCRAVPGVRERCWNRATSSWRLAHCCGSLTPIRLEFKKLGWHCHFVRIRWIRRIFARGDAEVQSDLRRKPGEPGGVVVTSPRSRNRTFRRHPTDCR